MPPVPDVRWLTYKQAAVRVKSTDRTVRRWVRDGLPSRTNVIAGQATVVIREDLLLAHWRERMANETVHQAKLRAKFRSLGLPEPARQRPVKRPIRPKRVETPHPLGVSSHSREQPGVTPWATIDPLASVKPMRGGPEFDALDELLCTTRPACAGDDRFTLNRIDDDAAAQLACICEGCPALELCAAYALAGRPGAGYWPSTAAAVDALSREAS